MIFFLADLVIWQVAPGFGTRRNINEWLVKSAQELTEICWSHELKELEKELICSLASLSSFGLASHNLTSIQSPLLILSMH